MARAIRVISVQRGHDPRDYALMAFGGAGPLHAARLAKELEIRKVVVPRNPGHPLRDGAPADRPARRLRRDQARHARRQRRPAIEEALAPIEAQAEEWFADEDIAHDRRRISRTIDMRYEGQNYELSIPLPDGPVGRGHDPAPREGLRGSARAPLRLRRRGGAGVLRDLPGRSAGPREEGRADRQAARPCRSPRRASSASGRSGSPRPAASSRRRSTPARSCSRA